jgi:cell wall-associated NlpC family hydrolase
MMKKLLLMLIAFSTVAIFSSCDALDILLEEDASETTNDADPVTSDTGDIQTSALRDNIIKKAQSLIGSNYVYGGESPAEGGFDCSGLSYYCYKQYNIILPRTSIDQYNDGVHRTLAEAKKADIVAFYSPVSHVGMIINRTTFIHSPHTGATVTEDSLEGYWAEQVTGASSYINE